MQWKPNVTVAALAERDGRFLVVEEEADSQVVFNQPAGHLERGETLVEAVKREVLEETAWEFRPESLVGIYLYPQAGTAVTYMRFCFAGTCARHHARRPLDAGILRAAWMSREELSAEGSRLRSPLVLRCIDDYLAGRSWPMDLLTHLPPLQD